MLTVLFLLWLTLVAVGLTLYGIRPRPATRTSPWPKWIWLTAALALFSTAGIFVSGLRWATGPARHTSASGVVLTDHQVRGRDLFTQTCKKCHTLADPNAISTVGPDLDRLDPSYELVLDAVVNGRRRGNGPMPRLIVDREQAKAVADYVSAVAGP